MKSANEIKIEIIVLLYKQGESYIANCPALALSSYGDTENEAKEYFEDALKIFITDTIKKGTLERCLLKYGWKLQQIPNVNYEPPRLESQLDNFDILNNAKVIKEQFAVPTY
jgi:hypothetical protein